MEKVKKKEMWKVVLLLAGLIHLSMGVCNVERIVGCATSYLDVDADGKISAEEIDRFMLYQPCGALPMTALGASVMQFCDRNHDGYMTQVDLEATPFNCLTMPIKTEICRVCDKCDANPPLEEYYNNTQM